MNHRITGSPVHDALTNGGAYFAVYKGRPPNHRHKRRSKDTERGEWGGGVTEPNPMVGPLPLPSAHTQLTYQGTGVRPALGQPVLIPQP